MVGLLDHSSEFRVITVQFLDAGICWTACRPIFITLSSSFKFAVSSNFFFCPLLIHFFSDSNLFCTFCSSSSQDTCHSGSPSSALSSKPLRATSSGWCITCIRVLWKKRERTTCIFYPLKSCSQKYYMEGKGKEEYTRIHKRRVEIEISCQPERPILVFLSICGAVNWRP